VVFILQNRSTVTQWLRGRDGMGMPPSRAWRVARDRLADTWHVVVILYVVAIYSVYALRIEGGFFYVGRATVLSVVIVAAARLVVGLVRRLSHRGFAISPELGAKFPGLEARANRYLPMLTAAVSAIVYVLATLTVLQAWDFESFAWLHSPFGRRLTGGAVSIGTVLLIALVAWEIFSSAIERYLAAVDGSGQAIPRSARARTLLPLLRTAVMVFIVVTVSLIVLSEIGVNIAPLLAGAGVVGIAVGFGSQALVKDIITGLFILIEDTLAVGDVVDLGKGHAGAVEAITVRTIRLRDGAGTIHTIPWSEVTTVNNMTRDYAYVLSNVTVSLREDPDRVIAALNEVGAELAEDPALKPFIIEPLEVIGVDRISELGLVVQVRVKTLPSKQWSIAREFNRRLKRTFDRLGIEMPYTPKPNYLADRPEAEAGPQAKPLPRLSQRG
jgi:small-conductance mechanosensitive channel